MNGWVSGPAIDDRPDEGAAAGARPWRRAACFEREEGAREVDVHHAVPLRHRHGDHRADRAGAGRRHAVLEAAGDRRRGLHGVGDVVLVGDVARDAAHLRAVGRLGPQLGDRRVEALLAPAGERDRRAVAQQVAGGGQPDAAPAAGDQRRPCRPARALPMSIPLERR